jgi:type IV pilus assembly protein PilA
MLPGWPVAGVQAFDDRFRFILGQGGRVRMSTTTPPPPEHVMIAGRPVRKSPNKGLIIVLVVAGACVIGVALIGIVAAIAIPGLLRARMSGNEASAIGSMRAIVSAQMVYSSSCGAGAFAPSLEALGRPDATRPGSPSYLAADLAVPEPVRKSGYLIRMTSTPQPDAAASCNGVPAGQSALSWAAIAEPETPQRTGSRYFAVSEVGVVFESTSPIQLSEQHAPLPPARPLQ